MRKFWPTFIPLALQAATPGAWEKFPTQTNSDAWGLYDYSDGVIYAPNWFNNSAAGPNADPYIGAAFAATTANPPIYNQGLWFFADELVANGAFIGDFNAAGVAGLEIDVLLFHRLSWFRIRFRITSMVVSQLQFLRALVCRQCGRH
jgi:hypothetical protein